MRKNILSICLVAAVAALFSACGPEVYVEGSPHHEIDRPYDPIVEVCAAAKDAVKSLMTDEIVLSFLKKYEEERKANPELSELPVVKLTKPKNETNDPDLNMTQLTDALCEALRETGCFEVSLYEGEGRREVSRLDFLADDPFYEQQKEPIQAARLVLYSEVVSNMTRDGQITVVSRSIKVALADANSGATLFEDAREVN